MSPSLFQPGEEITINYQTSDEPELKYGETLDEYQERADIARNAASDQHRCSCESVSDPVSCED